MPLRPPCRRLPRGALQMPRCQQIMRKLARRSLFRKLQRERLSRLVQPTLVLQVQQLCCFVPLLLSLDEFFQDLRMSCVLHLL